MIYCRYLTLLRTTVAPKWPSRSQAETRWNVLWHSVVLIYFSYCSDCNKVILSKMRAGIGTSVYVETCFVIYSSFSTIEIHLNSLYIKSWHKGLFHSQKLLLLTSTRISSPSAFASFALKWLENRRKNNGLWSFSQVLLLLYLWVLCEYI